MVLSVNSSTMFRVALVGVAVVSLSACAKKPMPITQNTPMASNTQTPRTEMPNNTAPSNPVASSVLPGSIQDWTVNVGDRVYFDTDSHDIRADAQPLLDAQVNWLRRYSGVQVRIEGNADERGTREYNLALGARRANAVRDYLVSHGVTSDRIATISFGKEQPIDGGTGESSWEKNRNGHTAIVSGAR